MFVTVPDGDGEFVTVREGVGDEERVQVLEFVGLDVGVLVEVTVAV